MQKEQTNNIPTAGEAVAEKQNNSKILPACDKENKDSFGKFGTAEELLKAYNSLESEFTKRSQRLKELEQVSNATNWEDRVADLVKTYPIAEKFGSEMAQEIQQNSHLVGQDDCLEKALLNVLSKNFKTPEELASDTIVVDKVLQNEQNQEKIIAEYLAKIKSKKSPITLPKGGAIPLVPPQRVTTIKEAGEIARKIIEES